MDAPIYGGDDAIYECDISNYGCDAPICGHFWKQHSRSYKSPAVCGGPILPFIESTLSFYVLNSAISWNEHRQFHGLNAAVMAAKLTLARDPTGAAARALKMPPLSLPHPVRSSATRYKSA